MAQLGGDIASRVSNEKPLVMREPRMGQYPMLGVLVVLDSRMLREAATADASIANLGVCHFLCVMISRMGTSVFIAILLHDHGECEP